jgi:hypothetical protein
MPEETQEQSQEGQKQEQTQGAAPILAGEEMAITDQSQPQ